MFKKRAQETAGQAATLIAVIALLIILYILFLPPEDRSDLLGENGNGGGSGGTGSANTSANITLLVKIPGRLDPAEEAEPHNIPNINLFELTRSQELVKVNPFYIKNAWFDKKTYNFSFAIDDMPNTNNAILSFAAQKHSGILTIKLNGITVYEYEITTYNIEPIDLKKDLLKQDNILSFEVSGVGAAFWRTNEYSIENIKVLADITDISRQKSQNTFIITDSEYLNIEKAALKFTPNCKEKESGALEININDRLLSSSVPECYHVNKIAVTPTILEAGENYITFETKKGSYLIDNIKVETELKETRDVTYYFELNSTQRSDVTNGNKKVTVKLEFVDDTESKRGTINVNGHITNIDQTEISYSKVLPSYWLKESNYIKVTPITTLNIAELRVTLD
ncbi:MAG: hypothetical protein Q7J54_02035 [Candidatus Woesearchaeota archaeon]|nr:hypothetical protein [Candidatus Woesearchaeota archaeon]